MPLLSYVHPFRLPELKAQDIYNQLNRNENAVDVKLDELKWGEIPVGKITEKEKIKPVFLRLDSEIAGASKKS